MDEEDQLGLGVETQLSFEQAVVRTRVVLRTNGFGILSEMGSPPIVGEAVGRQHFFMTAWHAMVAAGNLGGEGMDVGDHLAVGVIVYEQNDRTVVAVLDPSEDLAGATADLRDKARDAVAAVLERIAESED